MTFHEKSAWIMALALSIGGLFYAVTVLSMSSGLGELAPPVIPTVVVYTVILVVLAIVGHIIAVAFAPEDADEIVDERARRIADRSGYLSAYVLGIGVLVALGLYLWSYDGNLMFYAVFASLMLSQLFEYVVQIALYRRGV